MAGFVAVILLAGAPVLAVKMGGFGGLLLVALLLFALVILPLGDAYFLGDLKDKTKEEEKGEMEKEVVE